MSRRLARERAMQVLFQVDVGGATCEDAFRVLDEGFGPLPQEGDFARRIACGALDKLNHIDGIIANVSKEWNIHRMAKVDLNIMRLALYELFYCDDIPGNVSVNEAVELGKIYGGEESGRFINGILGKVLESPDKYRPQHNA